MDRYGVWGNPIAHSLSPRMHRWYAEQCHQEISYETFLGDELKFEDQLKKFFFDDNGKGCNITSPFKMRAYALAQEVSERCRIAQSCNTLKLREDGVLYGDNTDGVGLLTDLERLKWLKPRQKILILGTGGATRGVLYHLLKAKIAVYLWNRTTATAKKLVQEFQSFGEIYYFSTLEQLPPMDVVINALPLKNDDILSILGARVFSCANKFYDMQYCLERPTTFLQQARNMHPLLSPSNLQDGLGMLFAQGAESFNLWRGVKPNPFALLAQYR